MKKTVLRVIMAAMVLIALSILTENPAVVGIGVWGLVLVWYLGRKDGLMKRRIGLIIITLIIMAGLISLTDNVVLSAVATWVAVIAAYVATGMVRQRKRLKRLEEECDPNAFFEATERQLEITGKNKKIHAYLQIDLAVGEILMGECQAALDRLLAIDPHMLSDRNGSRFAYTVNLIECYYELGETEKAEALFEQEVPTLSPVNQRMKLSTQALMAERLFYLKRFEESQAQFGALLEEKISRRMRLSILFLLAEMHEQMGEWEAACPMYREVAEKGNRLAIAYESKAILQKRSDRWIDRNFGFDDVEGLDV